MARVQHSDVVIGAGAGVVVKLFKHGTTTPAVLWAAATGEAQLGALLTNDVGFYSVWLDEGEYDESIAASPLEDRVLSILSWKSLQEAAEATVGPPGEKGEKGEKGATGAPGEAAGGYQTGDLRLTAIPAVEAGWLVCNGAAVSRTGATEALFAAIGSAFGAGNGTTTFNLPDFRGRSPMGAGKGTGGEEAEVFAERLLGAKVGRAVHKLVTGQLAKHGHTATDSGHSHVNGGLPYNPAFGADFGSNFYAGINGSNSGPSASPSTSSAKANVTNTETGAGEAHPNVHPATVCNVWIKT